MLLLLGLTSCGEDGGSPTPGVTKEGHMSTLFSTDMDKLEKLLDLAAFHPDHVQFKLRFVDNSGNESRLSVPGPSDAYLQALLFFDSHTFEALKGQYKGTAPDGSIQQQTFDFPWLDEELHQELMKSGDRQGYADRFFGTGRRGRLWFLSGKVLLVHSTN